MWIQKIRDDGRMKLTCKAIIVFLKHSLIPTGQLCTTKGILWAKANLNLQNNRLDFLGDFLFFCDKAYEINHHYPPITWRNNSHHCEAIKCAFYHVALMNL